MDRKESQMNKVYVAGWYSQITQAKEAARELRQAGYLVTAPWIDGVTDTANGYPLMQAALDDLHGVKQADYLMLLALPFGTMYNGGGRWVEFGYALALGKRMVVVGEHETIFCHLPGVRVYSTVGAAINFMNVERQQELETDDLFAGGLT
jgi:nucleoside 2-deoxyribosyltransferase